MRMPIRSDAKKVSFFALSRYQTSKNVRLQNDGASQASGDLRLSKEYVSLMILFKVPGDITPFDINQDQAIAFRRSRILFRKFINAMDVFNGVIPLCLLIIHTRRISNENRHLDQFRSNISTAADHILRQRDTAARGRRHPD